MSFEINTDLQNRQVDSFGVDLDLGAIEIYSGSKPSVNSAPTGVLLWSFTFGADAFAAGVVGVAQKVDTITANAVASGIAGYGRLVNTAGTRWGYFDVSTSDNTNKLKLNTLIITNGQPVTVSSLTLIQPAS